MIFGTTLDGLATRNTVGSGRDAWETQQCEPLGPAILAAVGGLKPTRRPRLDAYKAPNDPPCWSVISLSLSSSVSLCFSQSTHSLAT